ncbi:MAG: hypothetical protein QXK54_05345 [Ignisphaera sp.]
MGMEMNVDGFRVRVFYMGGMAIGVAEDFGPRVLYLAPRDRPNLNLFSVLPDFGVETVDGFWRIYGGHRLWIAPESMPRTYSIDDRPVSIEVRDDVVEVIGNPELLNNVLKSIVFKPLGNSGFVEVVHRVTNIGRWSIEFSCWALSVMKRGGFAIVPIKPFYRESLLPDRVVALWPYTRLSDKRLIFTDSYIVVVQDPSIEKPLKIGVRANPPWVAYYVDGYVFIKMFRYVDTVYPDFNVSVEIYTNNLFLELETLGPLKKVAPGEVNTHTELWSVIEVGELEPNEIDIADKLESKILKNLV